MSILTCWWWLSFTWWFSLSVSDDPHTTGSDCFLIPLCSLFGVKTTTATTTTCRTGLMDPGSRLLCLSLYLFKKKYDWCFWLMGPGSRLFCLSLYLFQKKYMTDVFKVKLSAHHWSAINMMTSSVQSCQLVTGSLLCLSWQLPLGLMKIRLAKLNQASSTSIAISAHGLHNKFLLLGKEEELVS